MLCFGSANRHQQTFPGEGMSTISFGSSSFRFLQRWSEISQAN